MADERPAGPSPEDATRVQGGKPDDATVVKRDADATVMAAPESPSGTGGRGDGARRPVPDDSASAGTGEDDFTVISSAEAHGSTPTEPGSTADRTVASAAAADDRTVARPQGGAGNAAGGTQQAAADARTQAVPQARAAAGTMSNTYTLGGTTVASGVANAAAAPPVTGAVLLGIVTGLALFAVTALWLLRGH